MLGASSGPRQRATPGGQHRSCLSQAWWPSETVLSIVMQTAHQLHAFGHSAPPYMAPSMIATHPLNAKPSEGCIVSPCSILQVLAVDDPWIPPDMEIPRRGAVPVRFFGTYNFTWIESQRNLMPYDLGCQEDMASKGTQKVGTMSTC